MKNTNEPIQIKSPQVRRVIEGLETANKRMIDFKKMKNTPIVISKNGEIIYLDPFKVSVSK